MTDETYQTIIFIVRIYNIIGFLMMLRGFIRHYKIFASEKMRENTKRKVFYFGCGLFVSLLLAIVSFFTANTYLYVFAGFYNSSINYYVASVLNRQATRLEKLKFAPELEQVQVAIENFFRRAKNSENIPH